MTVAGSSVGCIPAVTEPAAFYLSEKEKKKMTLNERAAYVQGLFEGYGIDSKEKEGRILSEMLSLISDMADKLSALEGECAELRDYIEELDEDLGYVEESVFVTDPEEDEEDLVSEEDDGFYEVECPSCGETVYFDDTLDTDSLICPACGEKVMDFDVCDGCDGDCEDCASCQTEE